MPRRSAVFAASLCAYALASVLHSACGGNGSSSAGGGVDAGAPDGASPSDAGIGSDQGQAPPPTVGTCSNLAAVGVFENVTPPMAIVDGSPTTFAIAAD